MSWCAICTADIPGTPHREPLGRHNALVDVCDACATKVPAARESPFAYEVREGVSQAEIQRKANRTFKAASIHPGAMRQKTAGWIVVRVPRRDEHGKSRDYFEALATLQDKPWARELRYLGAAPNYLVFERPDPNAGTELKPSFNPIAWLDAHGAKT